MEHYFAHGPGKTSLYTTDFGQFLSEVDRNTAGKYSLAVKIAPSPERIIVTYFESPFRDGRSLFSRTAQPVIAVIDADDADRYASLPELVRKDFDLVLEKARKRVMRESGQTSTPNPHKRRQ